MRLGLAAGSPRARADYPSEVQRRPACQRWSCNQEDIWANGVDVLRQAAQAETRGGLALLPPVASPRSAHTRVGRGIPPASTKFHITLNVTGGRARLHPLSSFADIGIRVSARRRRDTEHPTQRQMHTESINCVLVIIGDSAMDTCPQPEKGPSLGNARAVDSRGKYARKSRTLLAGTVSKSTQTCTSNSRSLVVFTSWVQHDLRERYSGRSHGTAREHSRAAQFSGGPSD